MENLSIHGPPPPGGPQQGQSGAMMSSQGPPQQQQLVPQMFTTAAQLMDLTDKKLLLVLRDGRKLTGILRTWDQFANLVLEATSERVFAITSPPNDPEPKGFYADEYHGIFLVRGENVLILGEIDLDKDDDPPVGYEKAELAMVQNLAKERKEADKSREKNRLKKLGTHGFEGENAGEILL
ncbi:Sm-like ribonucleoprotein [Xylariaceae sp. FL1019]|nr:Sm-like ribonucleoprotein [Xylariaceae sp. FL1019]